jgi:sterol O-acyltransferase
MFLFTVRTYIRSLETHGYALNLGFATLLSKDALIVALSDAILVASTAICVPFAKALSKGWISYYWTGVITQHFLQTLILFAAITWTFNRCVSSLCTNCFRQCYSLEGIGRGFNLDFLRFIHW